MGDDHPGHRGRVESKQWFSTAFRVNGSCLPLAACIAALPALMAYLFGLVAQHNWLGFKDAAQRFEVSSVGFASFTALLGFLIVFRTSQSYGRYWNGTQLVQELNGSFYDALSSVISFTKISKAPEPELAEFRRNLICHFSLLTALCYHNLLAAEEPCGSEKFFEEALKFNVLGMRHFGDPQITALKMAPCRPSLVFHWIQSVLVEAIPQILNIPPPILSRAFNELADGLVKFEDCTKIAFIPFPTQYTQSTLYLLFIHWVTTPLTASTYSQKPLIAAIFSFVLVFTFWVLYLIAEELENPFGDDSDDIDLVDMQQHLNARFRVLLTQDALKPGSMQHDDAAEELSCGTLAEVYEGCKGSSSECEVTGSSRSVLLMACN